MTESSGDTRNLVELVDGYIATRNITYRQYRQLSAMVLADGNVDEQERTQINRLYDAIQIGRVKIVD